MQAPTLVIRGEWDGIGGRWPPSFGGVDLCLAEAPSHHWAWHTLFNWSRLVLSYFVKLGCSCGNNRPISRPASGLSRLTVFIGRLAKPEVYRG